MLSVVNEDGKLWTKIQGEHVVVPKLEQTLEWMLESPPDYHSFDELPLIVDSSMIEDNSATTYDAKLTKEIETANAADKPVLTKLKNKLAAHYAAVAEYDAKDKENWDAFAAEQGVIYNENRPIIEELNAQDVGKRMAEFELWVAEFTADYKAKMKSNPELKLTKKLMKTLIQQKHRELQDDLIKYGGFDHQNEMHYHDLTEADFEGKTENKN